ncbi:hypothetical protein ACPA9J_36110 [Pseudomonas aeruginosa]
MVTQKRMQDQNMSTVSDVLANAPGVTSIPMFGTGEQYYSRFLHRKLPVRRCTPGAPILCPWFGLQRADRDLRSGRDSPGCARSLEGGGNPSGSVNFVASDRRRRTRSG